MTLRELIRKLKFADEVCMDKEVEILWPQKDSGKLTWRDGPHEILIFGIRNVINSTKVRVSDGEKSGRTFLFIEEVDNENPGKNT